jgi:acetyltransferase
MHVQTLSDTDFDTVLPSLKTLLIESVAGGASIGFYAPLADADADRYWRGVQMGVRQSERILVVAFDAAGALAGAGQLALETRYPNGRHRAEVQKLMVAPAARRQGIARVLMRALEQAARDAGRTLLLLDTREGDAAEQLYRSLGWMLAGPVPGYVLEADGTRHTTLIFYRTLDAS